MRSLVKLPLLLGAMVCFAVSGWADTVTVDENGNGFYTPSGGASVPLAVGISPLNPLFHSYTLPFFVVSGTVLVAPAAGDALCNIDPSGSPACDLLIFSGNTLTIASSGLPPDGSGPSVDSLFDTILVAPSETPIVGPIAETGPEDNNGSVYTPVAASPGFATGLDITYNFISDGTATPPTPTPEPASLILLGTGLLGLGPFLRRGKK